MNSNKRIAKEIEMLKIENAQLVAQNNKLKKQLSKPAATPASKPVKSNRHVLRKSLAVVLVSFAVALLLSANILFWFGNTIVKPDRFVATTSPIIKDPVVQNSMALYATNSIFKNIDVQKITEQVLPPRADFLAPQLTSQLKGFTQGTLKKTLANPKFQDKWNNAISRQHQRIISFASKYQGNGDVSLNDVYNNLSGSLAGTKLAFLADKKLPPKIGDVTVLTATWLPAFHNLVTKIDTWRLLAVITLVLSLAAAIWLSSNRRRTIYIFSVATLGVMLATLLALHIIRERVVSKVDPQYAEGVRHVLQISFHSLVLQTITIMAAVAFVGAVAWVSGASRSANALKRQVALLFSGKLHTRFFGAGGPRTAWVQAHKRQLEWGSVAILGAVMLLVRLTLKALLVYILLIILAVLSIEVIGGQAAKPIGRAGQPTPL